MKQSKAIVFGASTLVFLSLLTNVNAITRVFSNNYSNGIISENGFDVTFNHTWNYEDTEVPTRIELQIKGVTIAEGLPTESPMNGLDLHIDINCRELPPLDFFNNRDNNDVYGFEEGDVEYIGYYTDGTYQEASLPRAIYLQNNKENVQDENLKDAMCSDGEFNNESPNPDFTGTTFEQYIANLLTDGVVSGYSDGTYRPNTDVKRGAMAKFIVNAFDIPTDTTCDTFSDVQPEHTFYEVVTTLKCKGIIGGYSDGTYKPDNGVSRGQVTKFVSEALDYKGVAVDYTQEHSFSDVFEGDTFDRYIAYLTNIDDNGDQVIRGYSNGTYQADNTLSRGAMAKIVDISRKALSSLPKGDPIGSPVPDMGEFLVFCPPDHESTEKCSVQNPGGETKTVAVDKTFIFDQDIAYKSVGDLFVIYKFNGREYVKTQEYTLPINQPFYSMSTFVSSDYIYLYQSRMINIDGVPLDIKEITGKDGGPQYKNDTEGLFSRYGIRNHSSEELERLQFLNSLSIGDVKGSAILINEVDEKNNTIYYHDPAGGGFFHTLIELNWTTGKDKAYLVENAGFFVAISPNYSNFYFADYTENHKLYKHNLNQESIIHEATNRKYYGMISISELNVTFTTWDYEGAELTVYSLEQDNASAICELSFNKTNSNSTMAVGETVIYLSLDGNETKVIDYQQCKSTNLSIPTGLSFKHVMTSIIY